MKKLLALPALVAVAVVAGPLAAGSSAGVAATAPQQIKLSATKAGYGYDAKALTAPAGKEFLLVFTNRSSLKHNVSLEVGELEYGATQTIGKG